MSSYLSSCRKFNYEPNIQYTFVQSHIPEELFENKKETTVPKLNLSREASSICSSNEEFQSARLKSTSPSKKSEMSPKPQTPQNKPVSSRSNETKSPSTKSMESPSYNLNLSNENPESPHDLNDIFRDRLNYLEQIADSPLYVNNSMFPQPWKIITKIQDNILRETIQKTQNDLNLFMRDENYVREFLRNELS